MSPTSLSPVVLEYTIRSAGLSFSIYARRVPDTYHSINVDNDGSETTLLLPGGSDVPPDLVEEIREWAQWTSLAEDQRGVQDALSLDGLFVAAISGVVGNAVWSVFPAAARWIGDLRHRAEKAEPAQPEQVVESMRAFLQAIEPVASTALHVRGVERKDDGSWIGLFAVKRAEFEVRADPSLSIVKVVRRAA